VFKAAIFTGAISSAGHHPVAHLVDALINHANTKWSVAVLFTLLERKLFGALVDNDAKISIRPQCGQVEFFRHFLLSLLLKLLLSFLLQLAISPAATHHFPIAVSIHFRETIGIQLDDSYGQWLVTPKKRQLDIFLLVCCRLLLLRWQWRQLKWLCSHFQPLLLLFLIIIVVDVVVVFKVILAVMMQRQVVFVVVFIRLVLPPIVGNTVLPDA